MAAIASAKPIDDLEQTVRARPARSSRVLRRLADLLEMTADCPIAEAG